MAFGRSKTVKKETFEQNSKYPVFLDVKVGVRIVRAYETGSEEVRVKRHWLAKNDDGTWSPKFGYNPYDKRPSIPVIVAVYDPETEKWIGDNAQWRNNPVDSIVASLSQEERKGKYAQEVVFLNILDRTPVKYNVEGMPLYPDDKGNYPDECKDQVAKPHNKIQILTGSSGDAGTDTLYGNLLNLAETTLDEDGDLLPFHAYDIKVDTRKDPKSGKISRNVTPTFNRKALPESLANFPTYDLKSWLKPWPNDAIQILLDGADYKETIENYGLQAYPKLKQEEKPHNNKQEEEEEVLF